MNRNYPNTTPFCSIFLFHRFLRKTITSLRSEYLLYPYYKLLVTLIKYMNTYLLRLLNIRYVNNILILCLL